MKTYLLDTYNRYKRYSETLDVKTKLCNRPWVVFNDGGEREVYKFKEDGTIKIILSGRVTTGTWEYDPSDKTLEIAAGDQAFMVHPGLYEDMLMVLQIDGTNQCAFLIEENNAQKFEPKTMTELINYFEKKDQQVIEEEVTKQRVALESKLKQEHDETLIQNFLKYIEKEGTNERIKKNWKRKCRVRYLITIVSFCIFVIFFAQVTQSNGSDHEIRNGIGVAILPSLLVLFVIHLVQSWSINSTIKRIYEKELSQYISLQNIGKSDQEKLTSYCENIHTEDLY